MQRIFLSTKTWNLPEQNELGTSNARPQNRQSYLRFTFFTVTVGKLLVEINLFRPRRSSLVIVTAGRELTGLSVVLRALIIGRIEFFHRIRRCVRLQFRVGRSVFECRTRLDVVWHVR